MKKTLFSILIPSLSFLLPSFLSGASPCLSPLSHPISSSEFTYSRGFIGGNLPHWGIDISVSEGEEVRAVRSGVVLKVKWDRNISSSRDNGGVGFGYYLIIDYEDGYHGYYGHLKPKSALVFSGDRVQGGEVIALSGNSGSSSGPHLHYGEKYRGKWIDPTAFIAEGHLRDHPSFPLPNDLLRAHEKWKGGCDKQ